MTDDSLPELRASDADRERHAEVLRHAAGEGRLTMDELDERLNTVYETGRTASSSGSIADVVVRGDQRTPRRRKRMPVRRGEGGANWLVSIMSGRDRKGRWRVGPQPEGHQRHGRLGPRPQRRRAGRRPREMTVFSLMGGADIRVPEGLNVELPTSRSWAATAPARQRAPRPRRPGAAPARDLDHGRHRRQARAQAHPRRAQGPQAPRARQLRPPGARAPAGRAAR